MASTETDRDNAGAGIKEYIVYRCPDGNILLDWNNVLWKSGYPAYPKHQCMELERGMSAGGMALPRLYAEMKENIAFCRCN